MTAQCVADFEGPWVEPNIDSGLVERCRRYWHVPVDELPNVALATFVGQRFALPLVVPEARRRLETNFDDNSEFYEGHLADALQGITFP